MKIICIGRNYADHAAEMGAERPAEPVVFMKPPSALLVNNKPFYYPEFTKNLHYEVELVYKIAKNGRHIQPEFAPAYLGSLGIGIDFTARDLQSRQKEKGHPWEIAKGFDSSAPISDFIAFDELPDPKAIVFGLRKNGVEVQRGNSSDMIFNPPELVGYVSQFFRLHINDLIFTGTPAGVGPVAVGDELVAFIETREGPRDLLHCTIK